MFPKVATLIVGLGLIACVMLSLRQQRIQAAHDLTTAQTRLAQLDRELLKVKLQIAARLTPDQVRARAERLGKLLPLSMERYQELVRIEAEEAARTTITAMAADR